MFTRDYIMRQLQQLIQALSLVLFHRREQQHDLADTLIRNTIMDVTGVDLDRVRTLGRDALLGLCSPGGTLHPESALAIADLLREDRDPRSHVRARWLYEAVLESGGTLPLDIRERIEALPDEDLTPGSGDLANDD